MTLSTVSRDSPTTTAMHAPSGPSGVLVASINASGICTSQKLARFRVIGVSVSPAPFNMNGAILCTMPKGLVFLLIMIAAIVVYTIAKVISYNRLSEQQWKEVDKSKLKEWDDEDDWD